MGEKDIKSKTGGLSGGRAFFLMALRKQPGHEEENTALGVDSLSGTAARNSAALRDGIRLALDGTPSSR